MPHTPTLVGAWTAAALALAIAPPLAAAPAKQAAPRGGDVTRTQVQAEAKRVFDRADTDKDGLMSMAEFRVRMAAVLNRTPPGTPGAPTKEDAQRLLRAASAAFSATDADGDGKLSRTEASKRPLAAFDMLDTDHDGVLTVAEKLAARQSAALKAGSSSGKPPLEPGR